MAKPDFESVFLSRYLKYGLGAMPKSDIDALVMSLLDRFGLDGSPLAPYNNQTVSERLRTPVAKVRKLRYEAALKFGAESVAEEAQGRLLAALASASVEPDSDKMNLTIEDILAKSWLQGQLKNYQQPYEFTMNSEVVRVTAAGLFFVLGEHFDKPQLKAFTDAYEKAKKIRDSVERAKIMKNAAKKFVEGAAKMAGAGVVGVVKAHLPF